MNPQKKSWSWILIIIFRVIFFLSLLPWAIALLATPFLFDNPNTTSSVFVLVAVILAYLLIGGLFLFLGWRAGKKGNEKLTIWLTSIPAILVVVTILFTIVANAIYFFTSGILTSSQVDISFKDGVTTREATETLAKYGIKSP